MADQPTDKTTTPTTSTEDFETIKKRAQDMVDEHEARNKQFELMERAYKIQPSGSGQGADAEGNSTSPRARKLFDPHAHNAINRIVQMYTANAPSVEIPVSSAEESENPETATKVSGQRKAADKAEEFLKALLSASDQVSERSLIADMLYAAAIYGEVAAVIDNLMEGEQVMPEGLDAPFVFEAVHPIKSFPRYSRRSGMYQHVYQCATTLGQIKRDYGAAADFLTGEDGDELTLFDYMDVQHVVWVDEQNSQPLVQIALPTELVSVPRISRIVSGGPGFLESEEDKRMPFLYAMVKSGLWAARNTLFTIFQTNAIDFLNPRTLAHMHPGREGEAPRPDWAERGGTEVVQVGEELEPYPFHSIPAELLQFNLLTTQLTEESTLSRISSGAAPGGVFAASGLNLMATLSRQATFMVARAVEAALGQMLTRTLKWIAVGGYQGLRVWSENGSLTLDPSELLPLGKNYRVKVTLKPDQQSERQMVVALSRMLREMGLGFEDFLRPMEEGQIISSVSAAIEGIKERAIMEAELPKMAARSAKIGQALLGVTETIPEAPPDVPLEQLGANMGAGQGVPPGMLTPDQINPMQGQMPPPLIPTQPPQMPPEFGQ